MAEATYDVSNALGTINKNLSTVNNNVLEGLKGIDVVHSAVGTIYPK